MEKNPALQVYEAIGEEIDRLQDQLKDFSELAAYTTDPSNGVRLRSEANHLRSMINGLDRARSIAFRCAMDDKEPT